MRKQVFSLLAVGALLALASPAYAEQPMQLSNSQLDGVTAGGVAIANTVSVALGEVTAETASQTSTNVSTVSPRIAIAQAFSQALAAGGFLFQAAAVSHADSTASLP
mgnify:FL=1